MGRGGYRGNSQAARRGRSYPYYSRPIATHSSVTKAEPCAIYTRTGRCDQKNTCRYRHDPDRVALCQQFIKSGRCTKTGGERCFLSHKPRPENTPICKHFARGSCNNSDCRFAHMPYLEKNADTAPVCRAFAINGWCDRELKCTKRHSFECPDFETHGSCSNPKCTLKHVIKASQENSNTKPVTTTKETVDLAAFVDFLRTASRESFDARTHHSSVRSTESADPSDTEVVDGMADSDEDADSDSELNFEQEDSEITGQELDVNADFIKV